MHNTDNGEVNWHSMSFKVIDFCYNEKPTYDFLLVINCQLSSISHRFRDIASRSRKPFHHSLSPRPKGFLSNFTVILTMLKVTTLCYFNVKSENRVILTSVVLSQYTRVTNTTDRQHNHDNNQTLQYDCNVRLIMKTWQFRLCRQAFNPIAAMKCSAVAVIHVSVCRLFHGQTSYTL